jgi:Rieske Fe-S protein
MSKLRLFFLIILIPISFFQCNTDNPIPEVYVNFNLDMNSPLYIDLNSVGNSVYIPNEGNKGLIVTHVNIDEYVAYDATCTYDPQDPHGRVEIQGISAVDTKCGSKFSLMLNGYVEEGPATLPLKMYTVSYNPNLNILHIHN